MGVAKLEASAEIVEQFLLFEPHMSIVGVVFDKSRNMLTFAVESPLVADDENLDPEYTSHRPITVDWRFDEKDM